MSTPIRWIIEKLAVEEANAKDDKPPPPALQEAI
jgi:hypothetical protein